MKLVPFKKSAMATIGLELELQLIDASSFCLTPGAKSLIKHINNSPCSGRIKPEITQSMIELNSSIHTSPQTMLQEMVEVQTVLLEKIKYTNMLVCGGGVHPFESWKTQQIYPTARFKNICLRYRYLCKRATVFGQHVHVGCASGEDAIYLTHALARFVPQLIAISASSPFYQSIDTGYASSRSIIFPIFPTGGVIPYLKNWHEFSDYFYKMRHWGIIESMKDVYWDIRPKPEFGTVEVRVLDTPLTLKKAMMIVAYIQALVLYLLEERSHQISNNLYFLYNYNRFQGCRYGYDGIIINPDTNEHSSIKDDILNTITKIEKYALKLNTLEYIDALKTEVIHKKNDASYLREKFKQVDSLTKIVAEQCKQWLGQDEDER